MTTMVPLALFGFVPIAILLFWLFPPRKAALIVCIAGVLFLPMTGFKVQGLPEFSKTTVISYGLLLGVLFFDAARVLAFRPRLIDIPMIAWCLTPFASSLSNGLGFYDGISAIYGTVIMYGVPYFIGRLYFTDLRSLRDAAIAIVIGGLIYVPLCLWEIRMSPQLHNMIYGFHQHSFGMTIRFGGFRPTVFMQHGLMVGMWMAAATLLAICLWGSGSLRQLWSMPTGVVSLILLITTILCKSLNSILLLAMGVLVWALLRWAPARIYLIALVAIAPIYMAMRISGAMTGIDLVSTTKDLFGSERAGSLGFRIDNEKLLAAKAMERPLLGWGKWGRSRIYNDEGHDVSITDGLWIIALGESGLIGLASLTLVLLLPALLLSRRLPVNIWTHPVGAAATGLAILITLYMLDNIPNAMFNSVYFLVAGGLGGMRKEAITSEVEQLLTPLPHAGDLPPAGRPRQLRRPTRKPLPALTANHEH